MATQRQMLEQNVEYSGDDIALKMWETGEEWSYIELNNRINKLANGLRSKGIREGDRIPIILYNTPEFPISVYACYKIGAIPVPLNYYLTTEDFRYIIDDLNAELMIYSECDAESMKKAASESKASPALVQVGGNSPNAESFDAVLKMGSKDNPPQIPHNPKRISHILYTSGTTGRPKGVVITQRSAYHRIKETDASQGYIKQGTVALPLSPLFHGGGMESVINPILCAGGTVLLSEDWGAEMAPEAVENHDVTYILTVPTVAKRIVSRKDIENYNFPTIEAFQCIGSPLSQNLAISLSDKITDNIVNIYGSTESISDLILRPSDLPQHAGKTGRPNPDKQVRVVEIESGESFSPSNQVDTGEKGQIIVKDEGNMDYYFNDYKSTKKTFNEGWYLTNDMATKDEDGYITITGRTDDMILSGGELISPVEVEDTLESHTAVESAIVVGVPDNEWGERVKAFVVSENTTVNDLENYCKNHDNLADYKRPKEYELVSEVERTPTGKKQRFKYRPS